MSLQNTSRMKRKEDTSRVNAHLSFQRSRERRKREILRADLHEVDMMRLYLKLREYAERYGR